MQQHNEVLAFLQDLRSRMSTLEDKMDLSD